jgi:glutaredoxin
MIGWVAILLVVGVIGAFLGYYFGYEHITGNSPFGEEETTTPEAAAALSTHKDARLVLYGVRWCPHSKRMKAIWQHVKTKYDGKVINGYRLKVDYVDAEANKKEAKQQNVTGYPTVKLIRKDKTLVYSGGPVASQLDAFVTNATSS